MSVILNPFQLLEINVISAQDLEAVTRSMRTYAISWVHPDRKLSTRVDSTGRNNPTWNDKLVFRVDDDFLQADTSAVMIEIYALHWLRDVHVGTIRAIVGNLVPPPPADIHNRRRHHHQRTQIGMRFVALQVRRHSGRPQGILNVGVAVLDSSMRSMPLYTQLSAVSFPELLYEEEPHHNHFHPHNPTLPSITSPSNKPQQLSRFRRSHSERSERVTTDELNPMSNTEKKKCSSSTCSDVLSVKTVGRASSLILSEPELNKGGSIINGIKGEREHKKEGRPGSKLESLEVGGGRAKEAKKKKGRGVLKVDYVGGAKAYITESEVGPSASEVAAVRNGRNGSEGDKWSENAGSEEGLKSKLERWEMQLVPLYDAGGDYDSFLSSTGGVKGSKGGGGRHRRRHTETDTGTFTCFGNVLGYECSCVCGRNQSPKNGGGGGSSSSRVHHLSQ